MWYHKVPLGGNGLKLFQFELILYALFINDDIAPVLYLLLKMNISLLTVNFRKIN